jgi:tRNA (guanine-N7-)-methyltransferase
MAQKKLLRFAQIKEFKNVLEYPENMQAQWSSFFKKNNPNVLELACGRGEYTIGLAALHPNKNFIGVDIKGNRMYLGAKKAIDTKLDNAAFLRTQIEMLPDYFAVDEVDEIWITFPDPHLRTSKAKKRLTHPRFLRLYQQILKPNGSIHLKTDSPDLYRFTKKVIEMYGLNTIIDCNDVYTKSQMPELKIRTHYEGLDIARSNTIYYLQFSLPKQTLALLDEDLQEFLKQTENQL